MSIEFMADFEKLIAKINEVGEMPNLYLSSIAKDAAGDALEAIDAALKPVSGQFLGRHSRNAQESHEAGSLKDMLSIKREHGPKGKCVYYISTTWYAHFKDAYFTTRAGKRINGTGFLTDTLKKMDAELKEQMIVDFQNRIKKVCEL